MAWRALIAALGSLLAVVVLSFAQGGGSRPASAAGSHVLFLPLMLGEPPNAAFLQKLNRYRGIGGLAPVTEDPDFSSGAAKHSRYMVENDRFEHFEIPGLPFFSPEGNTAAKGHLYQSTGPISDTEPIDRWLSGPLHGLGLLNPLLSRVGYGVFSGMNRTGAVIDHFQGVVPSVPPGFKFPFVFPKSGSRMPFDRFSGGESPDPLTTCPGYVLPTGPPVFFQFETSPSPYTHTATTQPLGGGPIQLLDTCAFSGADYANPNPTDQTIGRGILSNQNAVIVIPKSPLQPGSRYRFLVGSGSQSAGTVFDFP
jgi:hypothetical protein